MRTAVYFFNKFTSLCLFSAIKRNQLQVPHYLSLAMAPSPTFANLTDSQEKLAQIVRALDASILFLRGTLYGVKGRRLSRSFRDNFLFSLFSNLSTHEKKTNLADTIQTYLQEQWLMPTPEWWSHAESALKKLCTIFEIVESDVEFDVEADILLLRSSVGFTLRIYLFDLHIYLTILKDIRCFP